MNALAPLLLVALLACASPDGPFVAAGKPRMPLHEARAHCKQQSPRASGYGGGGTIDWRAYERCMADQGWVKPPPGAAGGAPPPTGGGSAY